ncbi:hypothetical protein CMI37_17430 [Candidatus Pacearchaeota archaeon]|nr:hypothetical protein [Candidatus Pacearchaeota archaeon]|tara:strand:- start:888 stop:1859 length:972 start_codon:yes stop_codon:yes gene_type:complete
MNKLDIKDKKIMFELDKDSRIPLSKLAKKIGLKKETVFHRLNNLIEKQIILQFHTVSALYRFGQKSYKIYLKLQGASPETRESIIDSLQKNKRIFWIGDARGTWDIIVGIWAGSLEDFFLVHDEILNKHSKYILKKEVSISRKNTQLNRKWFYDDKSPRKIFTFGEDESPAKLDEDDKKILDQISTNSRMKIIDIAEKVELLPDKVTYRIKNLEKNGLIKGYKCLFNASKLGFIATKVNIYFKNISKERKQEFFNYLKFLPNIIYFLETFASWDVEIGFEVEKNEDFYLVMDDLSDKFKDIIHHYDDMVVLREPKQKFVLAKK